MNDISIKPFNYSDLEGIMTLWNDELIHDAISKERFIDEIITDPNFDPNLFLVAAKNELLLGFVYGVKRKVPYLTRGLEETRSWIMCMAVDKMYQNQGIGTALVKTLEKKFVSMGSTQTTLCAYSPQYLTPGIDIRYQKALSFFENRGYIYSDQRTVSMARNLFDYTFEAQHTIKREALEHEGYEFLNYTESDATELIQFASENFGGGWSQNVTSIIKQGIGSKAIVIAKENNQIVGFCVRKIDGMDSRFGPIGVAESQRGKGLGGILLQLMLDMMKKNKIYYTYFLWTSGSNIMFYEKHGFEVYREYRLGGKDYE
ncbi:GNAT family N-acetyltransferase [Erysipelothrix urinaevulpis]|uniref:GNAT family N-acetyltransferase n=1 Tax=Erysipelothrix urinaevulpis TaxID=2683717 RepID=UPI00135B1F6A|nr:GNAT family N-acetyltransferase [Erysipelothrix urinaevulpis]